MMGVESVPVAEALSYADTLGVGCHSLIRVLLPALECMEIQLPTIDAEHILMQHTQL